MVERKKIKTGAGFLLAEIDYVLIIHKGGHQEVCLRITSENRTPKTIFLDENYNIPLSEARNLKARDLNNDEPLFAFENKENGRIEVVFKKGTRLPPGQKFSWTVTWNTSRFEMLKTEEQWITGGFTVTPGESYKGIRIRNHRVNLKVVFKRPMNGESYESLSVDQSNSHKIPAQKEEGKDEVAFTYDAFDLGKGGKLRATFVYQYESAVPAGDSEQKLTLRKRCSELIISTIPQTVSQAASTIVTTLVKEILPLIISRMKF
jgi:hypothetical protein